MSPVDRSKYGDGFSDGLTPLTPIDVTQAASVSELLKQYALTAFGGRQLGEAAEVAEAMIRDPKCFVVMTLSGAMTVAKQGLLVCEMIDRGWVQAIISTGALMCHGLVEAQGRAHFKHDARMNDSELYDKGYDRVYDTIELEASLDETDHFVRSVIDKLPEGTTLSSQLVFYELGKHLDNTLPKSARAILRSAYRKGVPIYVPAFTDSEIGLDIATMNHLRSRAGKSRRPFDPYLDLDDYARWVASQERNGVFTIGGGVPRNWAQQVGPYLDLLEKRTGIPSLGFRFSYGVRICPEPVHWGGMSGCTYSEGVSWGKFVPSQEGGRFAEVLSDATVVWPLLTRGLIERLGDKPVAKDLKPQLPSAEALFKR
ncbi:MAG: deoxyhypusine synthase family protein [Deltaproteobacteria bacterium]|nr:deoxyhypusine synthase family protein [Deltaproteobacteria bacterium]